MLQKFTCWCNFSAYDRSAKTVKMVPSEDCYFNELAGFHPIISYFLLNRFLAIITDFLSNYHLRLRVGGGYPSRFLISKKLIIVSPIVSFDLVEVAMLQ